MSTMIEAAPTSSRTIPPTGSTLGAYVNALQHQLIKGGQPEPSWFFNAEWQAGEVEAEAEIASNSVVYFDNEEDFLRSL